MLCAKGCRAEDAGLIKSFVLHGLSQPKIANKKRFFETT